MKRTLDAPTRRLFLLLLAGFTMFGAIFTVAGSALPQIIRTFGWSYTVTGLVLAASSAGYLLSAFVCGILVHRFAPKKVLVTGIVIGALGMIFFARSPSPWTNLALNLAVGFCQGAFEVVTALEVMHLEKAGQSRLMNLVHAFFCVGAVAGPASMGYVLGAGLDMVSVFAVAGIILGILAVLFALTPFPRVRADAGLGAREGLRPLRQPLLLFMTVVLFIYVGAEMGVTSWSAEYFVKVLGASAATGAFSVALFWTGLFVGRMLLSALYKGLRHELVMLVLACLSALALTAVLLVHSLTAVTAGIFLAGLGCSGFYPLAISVVGRFFKTGVGVGTAVTGGAAGSVAFPFVMALLAQTLGIGRGFWFFLGLDLLLIALTACLAGMIGRKTRREAAPGGAPASP